MCYNRGMSNLRTWLEHEYPQAAIRPDIHAQAKEFLKLRLPNAIVYDFPTAIIIVLQIDVNKFQGYLLFDKFSKATVSAMKSVAELYKNYTLIATTEDSRVKTILLRIGFTCTGKVNGEFTLAKGV